MLIKTITLLLLKQNNSAQTKEFEFLMMIFREMFELTTSK